jgi:cobalt/nickel transport system permease protein
MHLPDGYLSDPVCLATTVASAATLAYSALHVRRSSLQSPSLSSHTTFAAVSAGIFAAQMVNFPIASGTSGHMLGAGVAVALLGPWLATISLAIVLGLQCALFGDGGVLALGANVLNMGIVAPLAAAALYRPLSNRFENAQGKVAAAILASLVSVLAAALACTIELSISGTKSFAAAVAPMLQVHLFIGLAEAAITGAVLVRIQQSNRKVSAHQARRAVNGILLAIAVVVCIVPFASGAPDGLERVAEDLGFSGLAQESWLGVAYDYAMPGVSREFLAVALAGSLGVVAVYLTSVMVSRAALCKVPKCHS